MTESIAAITDALPYLLKEIKAPVLPRGARGHYLKLSPRRSMDLAVVGVAVLGAAENGTFRDVRIALESRYDQGC